MRLIDADHLKSILQEYVKHEKSYVELGEFPTKLIASCMISGLEKAITQIDSEPSAEQWISVKERLPEEKTDVLLQFESNMAVGFYFGGHWYVFTGDSFYHVILPEDNQPIAWMPLPEPYREDKG